MKNIFGVSLFLALIFIFSEGRSQFNPQYDEVNSTPTNSANICDRLRVEYTNISAPSGGWPSTFTLYFDLFIAPAPSGTYNPWLITTIPVITQNC